MPLFNRDTPAPATAEDRVAAAVAKTDAALAAFTDVVDELEGAAAELDATEEEANYVADFHRGVAIGAANNAVKARSVAAKVRALLG